ncbi:hypothetical protein TREMEDRAFT_59919 [Tremella mesenterica DSM 1558]|uniref:uncharacterized protein n=1 Tax=Tremella mesenterica (strain ATCC 24925 / CBS 8224 / DSM 1558 / NBRC 9311 / NRRL Y-6157 / RJB 2259-6 / UBC 559-6) TaxID=578456 RepID=UPI0003F49238|nr:uncharacterized protein TREMEDRAFT_59919 [Tremella mesenterica DSM 1558]EIW70981.1 hypothetical protein TREMEDRAFT_59919 [Tremella mesenterica DSM 1558]
MTIVTYKAPTSLKREYGGRHHGHFGGFANAKPKQIIQDISEPSEEDTAAIPLVTGTQEVQIGDSVRALAEHLNDGFRILVQNNLNSIAPQDSGAESRVQVHLVDERQYYSLICQPHSPQLCDAEGLFDIGACLALYTTQ